MPSWLWLGGVVAAAVLLTSFAKISIVLTILRNAIGLQGVPSGLFVAAWAGVLTVVIMAPVLRGATEAPRAPGMPAPPLAGWLEQLGAAPKVVEVAASVDAPLHAFLKKHAEPKDVVAFQDIAKNGGATRSPDDWLVLAPAFVMTELREAIVIGLLIALPFFVIDLLVGFALAALGWAQVPAASVALPCKLLLLLAVDGWTLISRGLVGGYA